MVLAEREASSTQVPGEEGVLVASYLRTMDDKIRRGAPGKPPVADGAGTVSGGPLFDRR